MIMDTKVLRNLGFTKIEIDIYLFLIKYIDTSASEIANNINISRTYVYDALEHLLKKGVVSYVLKNNKKRFKALNYSKLLEFIDNKKDYLDQQKIELNKLIKEFNKISASKKQTPQVEILEGPEGLKTVLNDVIKTNKNPVGWGATNKVKDFLPNWFIKKYLKEKEKKKIKTLQLFTKGSIPLNGPGYTNKPLPKKYSSPVTFASYGNKIAIFFWSDVPVVIRIENKDIAKSFKDHFLYLWDLNK